MTNLAFSLHSPMKNPLKSMCLCFRRGVISPNPRPLFNTKRTATIFLMKLPALCGNMSKYGSKLGCNCHFVLTVKGQKVSSTQYKTVKVTVVSHLKMKCVDLKSSENGHHGD